MHVTSRGQTTVRSEGWYQPSFHHFVFLQPDADDNDDEEEEQKDDDDDDEDDDDDDEEDDDDDDADAGGGGGDDDDDDDDDDDWHYCLWHTFAVGFYSYPAIYPYRQVWCPGPPNLHVCCWAPLTWPWRMLRRRLGLTLGEHVAWIQ